MVTLLSGSSALLSNSLILLSGGSVLLSDCLILVSGNSALLSGSLALLSDSLAFGFCCRIVRLAMLDLSRANEVSLSGSSVNII